METFIGTHAWVLVPLIFCARVTDVSLGTCRAIIVVRGHRILAAGIGFFESLIWLLAVSAVITRLDAWYLALAYAAGFATGNYVGIWLEARLAIGSELVRAIVFEANYRLADTLRDCGYQAVQLSGSAGAGRPAEVILVVETAPPHPGAAGRDPSRRPGRRVHDLRRQERLRRPFAATVQHSAGGFDWLLSKRR